MDWIRTLIVDICELPDRTSPEDYPDHMLVTGEELRGMIERTLENEGLMVTTCATAKPLAEWHEDDGPVIWWRFCRDERPDEASWIGTPLDDDWPGYHAHWTSHPPIPSLQPVT